MNDTAARRYSTGAMIFHWLIAIAVIANWRIAEAAEHAATREAAGAIMNNHKALGITILVLSLGRLVWRLTHPVPPLPSDLKPWEAKLAKTVHTIFYILMIGLPIGGWLASSFAARPVDYFGMFTVPVLPVGENMELAKSIAEAHGAGGEVFIYLIALHILGALKHTFFDKNGGIFRMLPFGKVPG